MTAHVQTDRQTARDRIAAAAVWWVNDQACSEALAELEEAVEEAMALPPEPGSRLAAAIAELRAPSTPAEARGGPEREEVRP